MTTDLFVSAMTSTALVAGLALLMHFLPGWTRPDLFFAVTVDPSFRATPEASWILKRYRLNLWAHAFVAAAAVAMGVIGGVALLAPAAVLYVILGAIAALVGARRQVLPHAASPSAVREAALAPQRVQLPGGLAAWAGPFAILGCAAVVLALRWSGIPARIPVHWNAALQPDRWGARTAGAVYGALVTGAFICAVLLAIAWGIACWARRIDVRGAKARREERFRVAVLGILLAASYALALAGSWQSLLPLREGQTPPVAFFLPLGLMLGVVLVGAIMLVRVRRESYGASSPVAEGRDEAPVGDRTPDECWKLGILYFNRDDPAFFVEKRFGLGYTVNFANPWTWVFLGVLVVVPLFLTVGRAGL